MLCVTCAAQSEIYRHVDKNGTVSYSNDECKGGVRSIRTQGAIKTKGYTINYSGYYWWGYTGVTFHRAYSLYWIACQHVVC